MLKLDRNHLNYHLFKLSQKKEKKLRKTDHETDL